MQKINYSLVILLLFGFIVVINGSKNDYFVDDSGVNDDASNNGESINVESGVKANEELQVVETTEPPAPPPPPQEEPKQAEQKKDIVYDETASNEEPEAGNEVQPVVATTTEAVETTTVAVQQQEDVEEKKEETVKLEQSNTDTNDEEKKSSDLVTKEIETKNEEQEQVADLKLTSEAVPEIKTTEVPVVQEKVEMAQTTVEVESPKEESKKLEDSTESVDTNKNLLYIIIIASSVGAVSLVAGVIFLLAKKTKLFKKRSNNQTTSQGKQIYNEVPQNDDKI